jgi:hypothetical protein
MERRVPSQAHVLYGTHILGAEGRTGDDMSGRSSAASQATQGSPRSIPGDPRVTPQYPRRPKGHPAASAEDWPRAPGQEQPGLMRRPDSLASVRALLWASRLA